MKVQGVSVYRPLKRPRILHDVAQPELARETTQSCGHSLNMSETSTRSGAQARQLTPPPHPPHPPGYGGGDGKHHWTAQSSAHRSGTGGPAGQGDPPGGAGNAPAGGNWQSTCRGEELHAHRMRREIIRTTVMYCVLEEMVIYCSHEG